MVRNSDRSVQAQGVYEVLFLSLATPPTAISFLFPNPNNTKKMPRFFFKKNTPARKDEIMLLWFSFYGEKEILPSTIVNWVFWLLKIFLPFRITVRNVHGLILT